MNFGCVAIGGAKGALWVLAAGGVNKAYRWVGFSTEPGVLQNPWQPATLQEPQLRTLAVGSVAPGEGEKVVGLESAFSSPCKLDDHNKRWEQIGPTQNETISVGDDGTVVRLDKQGQLYRHDEGLTWSKLSAPRDLKWISVVSKTNMWAVGGGGEIYSTIA
jgi:hypothetical protein